MDVLVLAGWLAWTAAVPAGEAELLGPIAVRDAAEDGPAMLFRAQRDPGLVAIRLAVPVREAGGSAGAAAAIQALARDRLEEDVGRVGGRARLTRSATHAVYRVVGPAEAFADLAAALRRAVGEPTTTRSGLAAIWARIHTEALVELETPEPLLRRRLQAAVFPASVQPVAASPAARAPSPDALAAFWARHYRPDRMSAVVVGAVAEEAVFAELRGWPAPPRSGDGELGGPLPAEPADPQILFPWIGLAYPDEDGDPAAVAVAARLIDRRLALSGLAYARAEIWWIAGGHALVVLASGRPTDGGQGSRNAAELEERLRRAIAEVAAGAGADEVGAARRSLRRDVVLAARSAEGLAEVLGEFQDRTGDPRAAERFLASLADVTPDRARGALVSLLGDPPVKVEVRP